MNLRKLSTWVACAIDEIQDDVVFGSEVPSELIGEIQYDVVNFLDWFLNSTVTPAEKAISRENLAFWPEIFLELLKSPDWVILCFGGEFWIGKKDNRFCLAWTEGNSNPDKNWGIVFYGTIGDDCYENLKIYGFGPWEERFPELGNVVREWGIKE